MITKITNSPLSSFAMQSNNTCIGGSKRASQYSAPVNFNNSLQQDTVSFGNAAVKSAKAGKVVAEEAIELKDILNHVFGRLKSSREKTVSGLGQVMGTTDKGVNVFVQELDRKTARVSLTDGYFEGSPHIGFDINRNGSDVYTLWANNSDNLTPDQVKNYAKSYLTAIK